MYLSTLIQSKHLKNTCSWQVKGFSQLLCVWWVCSWWGSDTVVSPLTSCSFSLLAKSADGSVWLSGARRRLNMLSSSLARSASSFSSCWASEATFGSGAADDTGAGEAWSIFTQPDYHRMTKQVISLQKQFNRRSYFFSLNQSPLTWFLWLGGFCSAIL